MRGNTSGRSGGAMKYRDVKILFMRTVDNRRLSLMDSDRSLPSVVDQFLREHLLFALTELGDCGWQFE